jgi:hypothetical protein
MQPHKQFITTSSNIMQNMITTSMIAETRKFKTSSKKRFRLDQNASHVPRVACTASVLHPLSAHEPTRIRVSAWQTFHRHNPPSSPHGEGFLVKPSRAFDSVSCGSICRGWFSTGTPKDIEISVHRGASTRLCKEACSAVGNRFLLLLGHQVCESA